MSSRSKKKTIKPKTEDVRDSEHVEEKPEPKATPKPKKEFDVTVVVPVRNLESYPPEFWPRMLASILDQQFDTDVELILINDGSEDNTEKIIDDVAKDNPDNVKSYSFKKHVGIAKCLNKALTMANGRYIHQFSVRSWYEPNALKKMVDALDSQPAAGVLIPVMQVHGAVKRMHHPPAFDRKLYGRKYLANFYMYRREASWKHKVEYVDYLTLQTGQVLGINDRDMFMQLLHDVGYSAIVLDQQVVNYWYSGNGAQGSDMLKKHRAAIDAEYQKRWGKYL